VDVSDEFLQQTRDALRRENPSLHVEPVVADIGVSVDLPPIRVFFEEVLRRLPDLELATDDPLPRRPSNFIVGIETMPVVWRR
jgi:hypothetical protein